MLEIQQDKGKKSYWDYQMQIHLFNNEGLIIHPCVNLVSNIGFDGEGTHTLKNDGRGNRKSFGILPLRHPESFSVDTKMDYRCFAKTHSRGCFKDMVSNIYNWMYYNHGIWHLVLVMYKKVRHGR